MQVSAYVDLPGGDDVEAVGESFYTEALEGLARDGPMVRWAALVPDLDNSYDRNAVCILIDGVHVGHLNPGTAMKFRPVADRIRALECDVRCASTIVERGGVQGQDVAAYAVVLDIGTPDECLSALSGEQLHRDPGLKRDRRLLAR